MDVWTIALFGGATFLAITSLVRLMRRKRDEVTRELRRQVSAEQQRLRIEKKTSEKKKTVTGLRH